jgi:tRNA(Ile)-lysidine synthase
MIVVAVSGGIDSMVLLDYLYQRDYEIVIAHINYQKRVDSYQDGIVIKEFIKNKAIIFEEYIVPKEQYTKDNFQAQARTIRYNFFREIAHKYHTNDVYIAHHRDDFLETYLFKKERGGLYDYLGIKEISKYQDLVIHRPLLNKNRNDIEAYSLTYQIPYHEDSSNASLLYTRNKIRYYLKSLSNKERESIYEEACLANKKIALEQAFVNDINKKIISKDIFLGWSENIQLRYLYMVINKPNMTTKYLKEIIRNIKKNISYQVTFLDTTIICAYDNIYMLKANLAHYSYLIKDEHDYLTFIARWQDDYQFKIKKINCDFPFIIRSYQKHDIINKGLDYHKFRLKLKKRRIPFFLREYLPVLEKEDEVILLF